jgi:hypothetical protein
MEQLLLSWAMLRASGTRSGLRSLLSGRWARVSVGGPGWSAFRGEKTYARSVEYREIEEEQETGTKDELGDATGLQQQLLLDQMPFYQSFSQGHILQARRECLAAFILSPSKL